MTVQKVGHVSDKSIVVKCSVIVKNSSLIQIFKKVLSLKYLSNERCYVFLIAIVPLIICIIKPHSEHVLYSLQPKCE